MNLTLWWNILHVLPHSVIIINTKAWISWGKHGHRILQLLPLKRWSPFLHPWLLPLANSMWQKWWYMSSPASATRGISPPGMLLPPKKGSPIFFFFFTGWQVPRKREKERSIWQPMTRHQPCEWGHFIPSRTAAKFYSHISESKQCELSSSNGEW